MHRLCEGLSGDPTAFRISDDEGKTWRMVMMPGSNGHVHANVIELEPGHLVAFMRNREAYRIHRSESFDWGETWTVPAPTPLPNNNSSISAVKLQSGRIAIAYNPTCTPNPVPGKAAWPGLRCPVAVALSEDGGLTFPIIRWMERGEGYMGDENKTNNKQYEYPYLMQGRDGMLHLPTLPAPGRASSTSASRSRTFWAQSGRLWVCITPPQPRAAEKAFRNFYPFYRSEHHSGG